MEISLDEIKYYLKHIYASYDEQLSNFADWKRVHDKVEKAWSFLDAKEENIIKLVYVYKHYIESVAAMYNVHPSTVYRYLDRACEKLYLADV